MIFSRVFAVAALALAPIVSSQSTPLQFSSVPGPFTIGKATNITWSGGSGDSVTLILLEGQDTSNLNTIGIIASNVKGSYYTWTPSSALVPADDYTLQITQGIDDTNYSGKFSIQSAATGDATTIYAVVGSSTSAVATLTPNITSTVTMQTGTAASGTGTGVSMSRNTTMVSPTLSGSATVTATTTHTTGSSTGAAAIAQATAQAMLGLGAVAAAAMYLL